MRPVSTVMMVNTSSAAQTMVYLVAWPAWWSISCASSRDSLAIPMESASDEVEQREQENPDQVHEVPVHASQLGAGVALRTEAALERPRRHPGEHTHADD